MEPLPKDTSEEATHGSDACGFSEEDFENAPEVELADPEEDD